MYFITAIIDDTTTKARPRLKAYDTRTFGYYSQLSDAITAVEENRGGMDECLYSYIVIEEIGEGIHPEVKSEIWFKWNYPNWVRCERPEFVKGLINFAIG